VNWLGLTRFLSERTNRKLGWQETHPQLTTDFQLVVAAFSSSYWLQLIVAANYWSLWLWLLV
jgi:hypothetical protein